MKKLKNKDFKKLGKILLKSNQGSNALLRLIGDSFFNAKKLSELKIYVKLLFKIGIRYYQKVKHSEGFYFNFSDENDLFLFRIKDNKYIETAEIFEKAGIKKI